MCMDLRNLKIIQNELRNIHQIPDMVQFVQAGGTFTTQAIDEYNESALYKPKDMAVGGLIEIAHFPDDEYYLHNGHHRAVSVYLGGREYLTSKEYYIKEWNYEDYNDIVFLDSEGRWRGYVTPLDIKTEARKKDIGFYKKFVREIYAKLGKEQAIKHIRNTKNEYAVLKQYYLLPELAAAINEQLQSTLTEKRDEPIYSSVD